ncbi:DUF192 domain-containing protein [Rubellimicrobium sp. CFH 75288]|uniref:DUF192 domain-containing protein n=1 Tax=Rubellimicrobium sp. CFH 75288 TaxID=2697034 RepID=UPI0014124EEC|nr:DUF192 domain-containing protein [Rubellimicrobium sp. CFH 75288]NAZ37894.1 DUF192 domain-containing protein [Rubellimicrobium sp. CFH 75288]
MGQRVAAGPLSGAILGALLAAATAAAAECREDRVTVLGGFGRAAFTVEVADDAPSRAQGLMHVESLGPYEGMLFVYDAPQSVAFWMENTLIPLDMIFAGADGTVTRIHENAIPLDRTPIPGGEDVQFVLEVNGGTAARLGIAPGDVLQHPAIGGEGAAAPCPPGADQPASR